MAETIQCKRLVYRGRVQGVGFRYTTLKLASPLPVTGTVKNLADGTVELIVEGAAESIQKLKKQIADIMFGNITRVDEKDLPYSGFKNFQIVK